MAKIFTIGHSTRSADEFLAILKAFEIGLVVDIRTVPRSRHNSQYEKERFKTFLAGPGIRYEHLPALGGLRHPRKDSLNTGWRNPSFRGYADYMQTPAFAEAIEDLTKRAAETRTAIMCAEAVPWRCHRSLVADALIIRGVEVEDIMSEKHSKQHQLTPWARVEGFEITYPEPV